MDIELQETSSPPGVEKRIIFGPGRFREDYVVRHFTVKAAAQTPFHAHDRPHYVIILEGTAEALIIREPLHLDAGAWAYVPPDSHHGFQNTGEGALSFLCIVSRGPGRGQEYENMKEEILCRASKNARAPFPG
jgi:quercetin dioxygenase-like cupin family protein